MEKKKITLLVRWTSLWIFSFNFDDDQEVPWLQWVEFEYEFSAGWYRSSLTHSETWIPLIDRSPKKFMDHVTNSIVEFFVGGIFWGGEKTETTGTSVVSPHLLAWTETWQGKSRRELLSPSSHTCPPAMLLTSITGLLYPIPLSLLEQTL